MSLVRVAKAANVSPATVSRVINRSQSVNPELAAKVYAAMREVGYVPPAPEARRGPKPGRVKPVPTATGNIVLLPMAMNFDYSQRSRVVDILAQTLAEHQLNLLVAPASDPSSLPKVVHDGRVDGVILQGMEPTGEAAVILRQMPVVWMMTRRSTTFWADHVEPENWQNGAMAAEYLLRRGHRTFAVINLQPNYPAFRIRAHAFAAAIVDGGGEVIRAFEVANRPDPTFQIYIPRQISDIINRQVEAAFAHAPQPTGFYVPNEMPAPMVLAALEHVGKHLGVDFEIVLGDYEPELAIRVDEHMAHIDVQISTIIRRTVEQLVWRIQHPFEPGPVGISVSPRLVVGSQVNWI